MTNKKKIIGTLKADVVLPSGRMYPKDVLQKAIVEYQHKVKDGSALVPVVRDNMVEQTRMADVAGIVRKLDPETLEFEIEILTNLDAGQQVADLVDADQLRVTPVGVGSLDKNSVVQDDYKLDCLLIDWKGPARAE